MSKKHRIKPGEPQLPTPIPQKRIQTPVSVSFRYIVKLGGQFCLSALLQDELRETLDCLRQLNTMTWQQVLQQGGRGAGKTGLAYTPYADSALRGVARPMNISPDIRIASLRASQRIRIFGCYIDHVFYLLWFDRRHEIVPVA